MREEGGEVGAREDVTAEWRPGCETADRKNTVSPAMQATSKRRKRQENGFSPRASSSEGSPTDTLILTQGNSVLDF